MELNAYFLQQEELKQMSVCSIYWENGDGTAKGFNIYMIKTANFVANIHGSETYLRMAVYQFDFVYIKTRDKYNMKKAQTLFS
jgi:hypothetical protein